MVKLFQCFKNYFSSKRINPMFYVEHFMKYLIISIFFAFLAGCTAPDPNPELKDVVYIDLAKELELTKKSIEQTEKELEDRALAAQKSVPQSGQLKALEKKVFETQNYLQKLGQQKQFFEIKLELRKNLVGSKYNESLKGGRPWPDPEEVSNYNLRLKLHREQIGWEKNKGIVKNVPRGTIEKKTDLLQKKDVEN